MSVQSQSAWETLGPFFNDGLLRAGDDDLTRLAPDAPQAAGTVIEITGRVLHENGAQREALVELWQADANGHFNHPEDPNADKADRNFSGFGRALTSPDGEFRFTTIKPGPVPGHGNTWQAPHINISIMCQGVMKRLVTRIYFEDEAENESDPLLNSIPEPEVRATLIAKLQGGAPPRYHLDIVMRGEKETAFFVD